MSGVDVILSGASPHNVVSQVLSGDRKTFRVYCTIPYVVGLRSRLCSLLSGDEGLRVCLNSLLKKTDF